MQNFLPELSLSVPTAEKDFLTNQFPHHLIIPELFHYNLGLMSLNPNRVQLIKEHHQTSEIHDQTQRQPDACKRLVLVKTKKKPLPFAGKEKRKKYYLLFVVVVAIPLSHGKGPASGTTLQCKRNADLPSGQDIPVSLLGPGQSVAYKAPEQSWIYFGNSPCDNGLGFRMGLDKSAKLVVTLRGLADFLATERLPSPENC
ncbi:hypothetical protein F5879DRAFT_1074262 [Lentinula edodes]|nr:hypothetical protein F5879DRAFT_1074262 [Lentinula edodes]